MRRIKKKEQIENYNQSINCIRLKKNMKGTTMSDNCKSTKKKLCNRFRDVIHSIQIVLIIFFLFF